MRKQGYPGRSCEHGAWEVGLRAACFDVRLKMVVYGASGCLDVLTGARCGWGSPEMEGVRWERVITCRD